MSSATRVVRPCGSAAWQREPRPANRPSWARFLCTDFGAIKDVEMLRSIPWSYNVRRRRKISESTGAGGDRLWKVGGIPCFSGAVYHEGMIDETAIRGRFEALRPRLDERGRRLFCAAEARTAGYGGVTVVARATGVARSTINRGLKDLQARDPAPSKVRRSGGGRPALTQTDPTLLEDLRALLESTTLIRCGRCFGCPRVMRSSRKRCAKGVIGSPRAGFPNGSIASATAVRSTARAWKAAIMSTGTLNSSTSTRKSKPFRPPAPL